MQPVPPNFDDLVQLLALSALSPSPSEAHGVYCGLLCAGAPDAQGRWLAELLPAASDDAAPRDLSVEACRDSLTALASDTRRQMAGPDMGFDLLLPAEERSLPERAAAVHEWARGFLFGLGLAGVDATRTAPAPAPPGLSPPVREVIADFVELTRMDLDHLEDDEESEQALAEIIEFIRVAAMLVLEDGPTGAAASAMSGAPR